MAKFTQNYGQAPLQDADEVTVDSHWLLGLSGGNNQTYQYGLTATGTSAANALPVPPNVQNVAFASVPSGTGALLPFATPGTRIVIYNHDAANSLTVYSQTANNPLTGSADHISSGAGLGTSATLAHGLATSYTCAAPGIWN